MTVARMLKVTVLAHQSVMDDLIARMQHAGVLDIESVAADLPAIELAPDDLRLRVAEERLADATFVRDFFGRYHTSTQAFGAFISEKIHMPAEEYDTLSVDGDAVALYRECEDIAARSATLERERTRLLQLAIDLAPWESLHLQISRWQGTAHVGLFAGIVPAADGPAIRQALRDVTPYASVEELQSVGGKAAWVVMAHRSVLDEVRSALALTGFQEVSFPGLADYPAEERACALERAEAIADELVALEERAQELSDEHYEQAVARVEVIASQLDSITVRERFGTTERTFMVSGWVRESQRAELEGALEHDAAAVDLALEEPGPDDRPPVLLDNPWFFRPFEVLTNLYGLPRYDEVDPTPLLAPFFLAFFAICVGDFGYGLMLIGGAWYIKNRLDVAPGVKQFMDLLMFGGAGAMVVGVLFGSYFALDWGMVKSALPFLDVVQVLDPLNELPTFLVLTIVLGLLQLFFGVLVAAYDLARRGDRESAFFDQISTILMFAAVGVAAAVPGVAMPAIIIGIGITAIFKGHALQAAFGVKGTPAWDRGLGLAWIAVLVAALVAWGLKASVPIGWVLLGLTVAGLAVSKTVRRSLVALLGGLYAVYGMTAFIGDTLSYTRLAALGLSGGLVGMVFNTLAGLVMGGATGLFAKGGFAVLGGVVVVVLAAVVFAFGHVFNVVINLLGAFVHPARLQFVEFFSKFYEGGGRAYRPFAKRTKSLVLHAGEVRQEGAGT